MQAIIKGLEKVKQELTASADDGPVSEVFHKGRNADPLALYFGEDPARCPFEQVSQTLWNFVRLFRKEVESKEYIEEGYDMADGKEVKSEDVESIPGKGSMSRPKEWQHLEISFKEIEVATKNFKECIGKGGYGLVYKGQLYKSGKSIPVATKRLNEQFGQGLKEFLTEVHLLSWQKHPNLISIVGYCEKDKEKILVYEYAQRGSLDKYLRRNNTTNYSLTWRQRLKICVGGYNMTDGKEEKSEDVESKPGKGSMSRSKERQHLVISLREIEVATKIFKECIGKGGYGHVYKGKLDKSGNIIPVAIKRLNEQFGQGLKEFLTEVHLLSGQKHPNLISLVGYCEEDKEKILVYEYAQRGSLDKLRRNTATDYTLTWHQRLKICVGVARGLEHLHYHVGEHLSIIHRDIKSANILLDQNWVAKVSDFRLSKLTFDGLYRSAIVSLACGTMNYIEPEYMLTGILKKKSDVYSFGMVLFEVLCGRLCTIKEDDGILLSGPLAKEFYERRRLDEIIDPSLKEHLNSDSMNKFSAIAYRCLHDDRRHRPTMDLVVKELEDLLKSEK
ncbi:serine/threonine/dual specificity protein kinase, catalytic domain-containing protein [Artemisia annua]|uniref:Serine/threonine/dual specificity protein kinase, catalytic domain-containing protein n=1 Tax=Artemisia annua TaxID=35608 RepID=A0A2U1MEM1_ARTAN|nr:serine/threonine/dual specificity protein kinase, catalytic domain-containing protein [Artemisia annua]